MKRLLALLLLASLLLSAVGCVSTDPPADGSLPDDSAVKSLLSWNREFPGFEHITEGVEMRNDNCYVMCVKN